MNKHSFKYSGLANRKTVDISPLASGKGVVVTTKNKTAWIRPKTGYTETALEAKGARPTYKAIRGIMGKSFYRADLESAALQRASQILMSQKDHKRKVPRPVAARPRAPRLKRLSTHG